MKTTFVKFLILIQLCFFQIKTEQNVSLEFLNSQKKIIAKTILTLKSKCAATTKNKIKNSIICGFTLLISGMIYSLPFGDKFYFVSNDDLFFYSMTVIAAYASSQFYIHKVFVYPNELKNELADKEKQLAILDQLIKVTHENLEHGGLSSTCSNSALQPT